MLIYFNREALKACNNLGHQFLLNDYVWSNRVYERMVRAILLMSTAMFSL
jgi:hypothetical protein